MIVLFSALVVVVAAVVLVVGMISGAFTLVYAGLALAAVGVVLLVIARFLGRSHHAALPEEPAPLPASESSESSTSASEVGLDVGYSTGAFPIERYDSLWVTQIVPQLTGLSADELAMVDARERGGRHRSGVLDAIAAVGRGEEPGPVSAAATEAKLEPDVTVAAPAEQGTEPTTVMSETVDDVVEPEPVESEPVESDPVPDGDPDCDPDESSARTPTFLGRPAAPINVRRP